MTKNCFSSIFVLLCLQSRESLPDWTALLSRFLLVIEKVLTFSVISLKNFSTNSAKASFGDDKKVVFGIRHPSLSHINSLHILRTLLFRMKQVTTSLEVIWQQIHDIVFLGPINCVRAHKSYFYQGTWMSSSAIEIHEIRAAVT